MGSKFDGESAPLERLGRKQREAIKIARETEDILKRGKYKYSREAGVDISEDIKKAVASANIFTLQEMRYVLSLGESESKTKFFFSSVAMPDALYNTEPQTDGRIACLHFGSALHPEGECFYGSETPEALLLRSSALLPCLRKFSSTFYAKQAQYEAPFYNQEMLVLYASRVPVFRKDNGDFLPKPLYTDVATIIAPDLVALKKDGKSLPSEEEVMQFFDVRIRSFLKIASSQCVSTLVIGAWESEASEISPRIFAKVLVQSLRHEDYRNIFKRVIFSVPRTEMQKIFEEEMVR